MRTNKLKLLSIAICCFVVASWSEAQCMDSPEVRNNEITKKIKKWDLKAHDLSVNNYCKTESYSAIDSIGNLYSWTRESDPILISSGYYEPGTLYTSLNTNQDHLTFAYDRNLNKIVSVDPIKTCSFPIPANFIVNHVGYYWSPRMKDTVCLVQGTISGASTHLFAKLDTNQPEQVKWTSWSKGYIGKPIFVEAETMLMALSTYAGKGYDKQWLEAVWDYTGNITSWSSWDDRGYIGDNYHITSITGSTARNVEGGYSVAVTTPTGLYHVIANGINGWPILDKNGSKILNTNYGKVTDAKSTSSNGGVTFFHLIKGNIYSSRGRPKESSLRDNGKLKDKDGFINNVISFSVPQESLKTDQNVILYSDGHNTILSSYTP